MRATRFPDESASRLSSTAALERGRRKRSAPFGVPVAQALGIIEIGLPFINLDFAADRPAAVGRVLPAYELRLEDVGLGTDRREVLLRGKGFLDAYYRPWRTRAEIMPDGWFRTGDLGTLDADGCLFLHGRSKDVISVLGIKVFPQEIEAVLTSHPGVQGASSSPSETPGLARCPALASYCGDPALSLRRVNCWSTAGRGWPASRCRSTSNLSMPFPGPPAVRSFDVPGSLTMTASKSLPPEPRSSRGSGQALSAMDNALLSVDRILRGIGTPGFETQSLVWLAGRIDVNRLRTALVRLSDAIPW